MSKKSRKEGAKVANLIKANKAEFYIADVDLGDNSKDVVLSIETLNRTLGKFKSAYMLISAGTKVITVVAYVPPVLCDKIDHKEWVEKSVIGIGNDESKGNYDISSDHTSVVIEANTPFKLKDMVRGNGFSYLKKQGCMEEEEDSDEFIGFDDW